LSRGEVGAGSGGTEIAFLGITMQRPSPAGTRTAYHVAALLIVAALAGAPLGCGSDGVLSPAGPAASPDGASPTVLWDGGGLGPPGGDPVSFSMQKEPVTWEEVVGEGVDSDNGGTVSGSRYTLTFDKSSLKTSAWITIKERDPGVVDVELGPDGLTFESPVLLEISYEGTANDPKSPDYNGLPPRVFWFNPDTGTWKAMPGTDDPGAKTYRVWLKHFSRYAMGDGAGWKPQHHNRNTHTDEIQWY
jgi:hypothetical protein